MVTGVQTCALPIFDLLGMGTQGLRGKMAIADRSALNYTAHLERHVRGSLSLGQLLEEYFEVPVRVTQFQGAWNRLPASNLTVLGGPGGPNEMLGSGVVVGDEIWDQHGRIGVTLGPMILRRFIEFLPGEPAHRDLAAWLRLYSNGAYESEVRLVLVRNEVPRCTLGVEDRGGAQLGLLTWLNTRPLDCDPADASYVVN
jgi:type VI secretion system protein ImpH